MAHSKRKECDENKEFFCLRCYNVLGDRKSYVGRIWRNDSRKSNHETYVSRGLSRHLVGKGGLCGIYYKKQGLVLTNGKFDFSTSMTTPNEPVTTRRRYSADEYGLVTSTTNTSTTTERLSNRQVIHNLLCPTISREAIDSHEMSMVANKGTARRGEDEDKQDVTEFPSTLEETEGPPTLEDGEDRNVEEGLNNWETEDRSNSYSPALARMKTEIELMHILKQHKMPLKGFATIWNWAVRCSTIHKFKFENGGRPRSRKSIIDDICEHLGPRTMPTFRSTLIPWLPDERPREVHICQFQDALFSLLTDKDLMKEENLSFPNCKTPTSPEHDPKLTDNTEIQQLHHGSWWCETWKGQCEQNSNEIMVPIILYMDGISLDVRGNLNLTPLNMTLGIFNLETRSKAYAWRTIYFHPDVKHEQESIRKTDPADKVQNLHTGIRAAMRTFKEICEKEGGVRWNYLPYAGGVWKVKMKFSIAYVIGDTEMHDRLCGKYQARGRGVEKLCRHCKCDTANICNPSVQYRQQLWKPSDFDFLPGGTPAEKKENCRRVSHHSIHNAFHELNFGANDHNIHLASPGECLHMHQLGVAKRAVESFKEQISGRITHIPYAPEFKGSAERCHSIGILGQEYGALLSRQSDRDFPRTKFGTDILNNKRKEGHDFAGVIISTLLALVSKRGRKIVNDTNFAKEQIQTMEWILSMEEFLKHGRPTIGMAKNLPPAINVFVKRINRTSVRGGMGTNLIKTHLYFHLPKYIELWGPPFGWDSAPSESHHKTEIKAPSKNTQQRASELVRQTAIRQSEQRVIETAMSRFKLRPGIENKDFQFREGAKFCIKFGADNKTPTMDWTASGNRENPHFPEPVLAYCCKTILPLLGDTTCVYGCTEHKRYDSSRDSHHIFRSHPSFRSNTGQRSGIWMDWAAFRVMDHSDNEITVPGQVMCFLKLKEGDSTPAGGVVGANGGVYAVVRSFKEAPKKTVSTFVSRGELDGHNFELYDTETIVSELAVVPDLEPVHEKEPKEWLVVQRREEWRLFLEKKLTPNKNPAVHSSEEDYDDSDCDLDPDEMDRETRKDREETKEGESSVSGGEDDFSNNSPGDSGDGKISGRDGDNSDTSTSDEY